jgi:ABC-type multidrug transport system fused ATPase/permease subunit
MNNGLASWFAVWHPRYRVFLFQLAIAGVGAAVLEFAQNRLLQLITQALAQSPSSDPDAATLPSWLPFDLHSGGSAEAGWRVAFICLGLFVVVKGIDAAVEYWKARVSGRLKVKSEDDMESEILGHLLRKDEAFFSRHSPAETVSRLAVDVYRISDRRPLIMNAMWSVLLILGNLAFFVLKDWWMALLALAGCLAGAIWTQRMTRHVKQMDCDYMRQDDSVKSRFEDYLRAAAEVQVGRLHSWVRNRLGEVQEPRTRTYMKYVRLSAALNVGSIVAYLLTFVSMIVVIRLRASGHGSESWTLVPVVIWAMPTLFGSASQIIMQNVQLQLANTSIKRLLEYEAQEMAPGGNGRAEAGASQTKGAGAARTGPVAALAFQAQGATYRYSTPEGPSQGGVVDVTTEFSPGKWTAIVGGAGSGKSTLVRLLLGRVKPQAGTVLYGHEPAQELASGKLSNVVSFMPQSPALLNATILENILLGRDASQPGHRPGAPTTEAGPRHAVAATAAEAGSPSLAAEEVELVERIGLGRVCRLKAIDMTPRAGDGLSSGGDGVAEIRNQTRQWLASHCQAEILPYESGYSDRKHWILECLLEGRCDRGQAAQSLLKRHGLRKLSSILPAELATRLAKAGQTLLNQSQQLLAIPNYHVYAQLALFPLSEPLWELRSANAHLGQAQTPTPRETAILCAVALTCCPAELAGDEHAEDWCRPQTRKALGADTGRLRDALGDACVPFDVHRIHPHLTWRENLLFGVLDTRNSRAKQILDQSLLEFIEQDAIKDVLTQAGLHANVGRLGGNLSGGQGQLVALCRTILRGTAVLILDEPTSALDPVSRTKVAQFLRELKEQRIVITVSHDPEFVRQADEVKVIDSGRLVASGTFEQLKEGSEVFRRILGQT